jgi:glycine/D-amino acid oxidase-like deaminating enzyme
MQDGLPLIGRVPQIEGVYVATGHNVWGIQCHYNCAGLQVAANARSW